jgi:hypothetical protein
MPILSGSLLINKYMTKAKKVAKKKAPVKKNVPSKKKALDEKKAAKAPARSKKGQKLPTISRAVSTRFMRGVQDLLRDHGLNDRFEVLDLKLAARGRGNDCGCVFPERPHFIFVNGKFVCDGCEPAN